MSHKGLEQFEAAMKDYRDRRIKRAEQLGMTYSTYEEWYRQQNPIIRHREFVAIYGPSDDPYDDFAIRDHVTGKTYYDYDALGPTYIQKFIKWLQKRIFTPLYNKLRERFGRNQKRPGQ